MPIVLYSRRGCHLCERAEEWLGFHAPQAGIIDVDADAGSAAAYGLRVPVLVIDGAAVLEGGFDEADLVAVIRRDSGRGDAGRR